MPAGEPTILATSGGMRRGVRTAVAFGPLVLYAIELAGVSGRRPKLCHVGTAMGDQRAWQAELDDAARAAGIDLVHLTLFPMPPTDDLRALLLEQDAVWVGGGSVANLLALWRLHGVDVAMAEAWRAGVVLGGVSAGSICWHVGGTTDSFGPDLRAVTDGLGLIPYGNGVHYDSEEHRRPLLQRLVAEGTLPTSYASDDGVGIVYRGTDMVEAVTEVRGRGAYLVEPVAGADGSAVRETRIEPRLLSGDRP